MAWDILRKMYTQAQIRLIASATDGVDERTVTRFLAGEAVRPSSRSRIRAAMSQLGLGERVTANGDGPPPGNVRIYGHASFYPELDQRERAEALNAHVTKLASRQAAESSDDPRTYVRELIATLTKLSEQSGIPFETVARTMFAAMQAAEAKRAKK